MSEAKIMLSRVIPESGESNWWICVWLCPDCGGEIQFGPFDSKETATLAMAGIRDGGVDPRCGACTPETKKATDDIRDHLNAIAGAVLAGESFDMIDALVGLAIDDGTIDRDEAIAAAPESDVSDLAGAIDLESVTAGGQEQNSCDTCGNAGVCERDEPCVGWYPPDVEEPDDESSSPE